MFLTIVLIAFPGVSLAAGAEPPGGYYTTRYDHFDIENILNQKRLVVYYAACLLDKGPCTPQGTEFKSILPEAIKTNCLRCTEKQRVVTTRSIRRLQKEYPDIWSQLERKWDPKGENVKRLLASVNKPKPAVPIAPLIIDKFGGSDNVDTSEKPSTTKTTTTVAYSSTLKNILMAKPTSKQPTTFASTFAATQESTTIPTVITSSTLINALTTKPTTATFTIAPTKQTSNHRGTMVFRPFNSIGPNLIVPNPKILLNKVIHTASMVFSTVLKG